MGIHFRRVMALLSVLAVVSAATACSSSDQSDELLVYNAQHESLTKEWIDAFTKETGIKVTYRQGGDTELGNQLIAEIANRLGGLETLTADHDMISTALYGMSEHLKLDAEGRIVLTPTIADITGVEANRDQCRDARLLQRLDLLRRDCCALADH